MDIPVTKFNESTVENVLKNLPLKSALVAPKDTAEAVTAGTLDDLIFENRNQDYGAYTLRKDYIRNMGKGLFLTVIIVLIVIVHNERATPTYKAANPGFHSLKNTHFAFR